MTKPTDPNPPKPPVTVADLLTVKKSLEDEVRICLDSATADRLLRAEKELNRAKGIGVSFEGSSRLETLEEAQAEHEAAVAANDAATALLKLRAVPRWRLKELIEGHRPTQDQRAEYKAQLRALNLPANMELEYNPETFPPVLIAETVIEPKMTVEEAEQLWNSDAWSDGELGQLLQACQAVNKIVR